MYVVRRYKGTGRVPTWRKTKGDELGSVDRRGAIALVARLLLTKYAQARRHKERDKIAETGLTWAHTPPYVITIP